ncbi:MAG: glycosyltransferase [Candidatus Fermentibacteraceae bacterium]
MRRLLLITYTFPPLTTGGTPVVLNLSRYLPPAGWQPLVLTASRPRGMPVCGRGQRGLLPADTVVRRVPEPPLPGSRGRGGRSGGGRASGGGALRRHLRRFLESWVLVPDRLAAWRWRLVPEGVRLARAGRADAVMSFGPHHSLHLHALAVAYRIGLPCVCFFGDLWLQDAYVSWPSRANRRMEAVMEARTVARASGIIATTEGSAEYFRQTYGPLCPPLHVAPNAYDPRRVRPAQSPPPQGGEMLITYTGSFFANQTPQHFLSGLRLFSEAHPHAGLRVRLVGGMEPAFADLHVRMGLEDIVDAPGPVDFREVPGLQAESHLLLTMVPPLPGAGLKCSSKLAEYLRVGRPVMAVAPPGDMTGLVERLDAGYTCQPRPADVAECLHRAWSDWREGKMQGPADPDEVERLLDARRVMGRMADFLDGVADGRPGGCGTR